MRRKAWIAVATLLALLIIADTVYWNYTTKRLAAGITEWADHARAAGWQVQLGPMRRGGWPFAGSVTITGSTVGAGAPLTPDTLGWRSERLRLRIPLWYPTGIELIAEGRQSLHRAGGEELSGTADDLRATLPMQWGHGAEGFDLAVRHLSLTDENGSGVTIGLLQGHAELPDAPAEGEPVLRFSVSTEAIGLPGDIAWPLGPNIASLSLDGTLQAAIPTEGTMAARAAAWRDAGGSLEIHRMALGWGPLGLAASATLALDDQLQPMGAGNGHFVGYAATLDALASNGVMSRSAATAAKAVLALLAGTSSDGEVAEVDVPLTLQYRTLSMRQVPLVRLPELDWPLP